MHVLMKTALRSVLWIKPNFATSASPAVKIVLCALSGSAINLFLFPNPPNVSALVRLPVPIPPTANVFTPTPTRISGSIPASPEILTTGTIFTNTALPLKEPLTSSRTLLHFQRTGASKAFPSKPIFSSPESFSLSGLFSPIK